MKKLRSVRLSVLAASLLTLAVAACNETWEGAKEDTRENVKTSEGLEKPARIFKSARNNVASCRR
jgi:predicted small secreted protein